jgi:pimeloyl-ACP methyl ester carboxylesterase
MTTPGLIKSLTLIEPMVGWVLNPHKDSITYKELHRVAEYFWNKYSVGKVEEGIKYYFDYWNGNGAWDTLDSELSEYVLDGAEKNFFEFEAIFDGGKESFASKNFLKPVLLIGGEKSQSPPLRIIEILECQFPNVQKHLIEGAKHMSPITHSSKVNFLIRKFLSS